MIRLIFSFIFIYIQLFSFSQSGIVKGRVFNGVNNESISFAKIKVIGFPKGAISGDDGLFETIIEENILILLIYAEQTYLIDHLNY